jgi:hypothetical protein
MTEETRPAIVNPTTGESPRVLLNRIDEIHTHEIMDSELRALSDATNRETRNLGFFTFFGGVFATIAAALATSPPEGAIAFSTTVAVGLVCFIATAWFGVSWNQERRKRPEIIERIRNRGRVYEAQFTTKFPEN